MLYFATKPILTVDKAIETSKTRLAKFADRTNLVGCEGRKTEAVTKHNAENNDLAYTKH